MLFRSKKQAQEAVKKEALRSGAFYINNRWLGGMLTNFKTIKTRIAKLKDINDTGLLPIDVAKQSVEPILKNQKKAEIIKKKMSGTSLEAVSKSSGASVLTATGVSIKNPIIPNIATYIHTSIGVCLTYRSIHCFIKTYPTGKAIITAVASNNKYSRKNR